LNDPQWTACVQVRQKVEHKRTFLYLEQLILKHGMEENTIGIKSQPDGLDFYYGSRSHGLRMVDFLQQVVPVRARHDKQLVSHDANNNSYNYQYTFMMEIVPLCKEDIVCLPHKVSLSYGGIGPIMLCTRVGNAMQFTDVSNLRQIWIDAAAYYRQPYRAIGSAKMFVEYVVLDVEIQRDKLSVGRYCLADAQVARVSDFGKNDLILHAKTHLGHHLQPGDTALGYDLASLQIVDPELEKYRRNRVQLPDVLLVKKSYQEKRRRRRAKGKGIGARIWRLRRMDIAEDDGAFYLTLVPIRPRSRCERRSLRTLPGASLRPGSLAFNPRSRRLSTPLLTPFNSTPPSPCMERPRREYERGE
jgi:nonsense-mediated mRNA decay protein 3